ncbi:hypothetical protein CDAR_481071 [Caerostris darwini]|uniref:Uncharacterized protein n=1 Tax=Caerostris darwini TaxID=1538125 RepID=A0AAV4W7Q6_9ARAC|nr:hypothetical protein CDAR_481071 [Caerostris darwini]
MLAYRKYRPLIHTPVCISLANVERRGESEQWLRKPNLIFPATYKRKFIASLKELDFQRGNSNPHPPPPDFGERNSILQLEGNRFRPFSISVLSRIDFGENHPTEI